MEVIDYMISILEEVIVYIISGIIIISFGLWFFWKQYSHYVFRLKLLDAQRENKKDNMPLRWQAYERIILFVERIRPENILPRIFDPYLSAAELEQELVAAIRNEYEHNVTQQLYVGEHSWKTVVQLKDMTLLVIRQAAAALPDDATAKDLSASILRRIAEMGGSPYDLALNVIRSESNS